MKKFIGGILFTGGMVGFGKVMYELGRAKQKKEFERIFIGIGAMVIDNITSDEKED